MMSFKPKINLKTFVALALIFFGTGFIGIIVVGYSIGNKSSSTLPESNSPLSTNNASTDGSPANTKDTVNTNQNTPTENKTSTAPATTTTAKTSTPTTTGTTPAPAPVPTPTPVPAPAPTYCSGQTTCYGRSDLAAHASSGSCWGYINNVMYNVTSLISSHSGGASPIRAVCGGNIGAALNAAPSNGKHRSALSNSAGSTLWGYKIGYYDANKP